MLKKCNSHERPEIYIECVGLDCPIFSFAKYCKTSAECSPYATCSSIKDMADNVMRFLGGDEALQMDVTGFLLWDNLNNFTRCANYNNFVDDMKNVMRLWSKFGSGDSICSFDVKHFLAVLRDWPNTQAITVDGNIKLFKLLNFS